MTRRGWVLTVLGAVALGFLQVGTTMAALGWVPV